MKISSLPLKISSSLLLIALLPGSLATGPGAPVPARAELLHMLSPAGARPAGVPADFECAWRALALDYAKQLQPSRPASAFQDVHDALELGTLCGQPFVAPAPQPAPAAALSAAATTVYVDAVGGSDSNPGTQAAPFASVAFAVAAVRAMPQPATVLLRGNGVHRFANTVVLTAADSGLTIAAFPGEQPVLSSGRVLNTQWQPAADVEAQLARRAEAVSAPAPAPAQAQAQAQAPAQAQAQAPAGAAPNPCASPSQWLTFASVDAMYDDWPNPNIKNVSTMASHSACEAACKAADGPPCNSWIWYDPAGGFGPTWDAQCFLRSDSTFVQNAQDNTWSGTCGVPPPPPPPPNVYVADLNAGGTPLPEEVTRTDAFTLTLFASPDGGRTPQRAFRARYPNANLETDLFPKGWSSGGKRLSVPCDPSSFTVTHTPLPENYGPGMFSDYYFGSGGTCDRFQDGEWLSGQNNISYWCQPNGRTASCTYLVASPVGMQVSQDLLPNAPYTSDIVANGAVVQYWRQGHWFSMMVRVDNATYGADNSTTLGWSYGAFQGAEGDAQGEDWYIEHVKEELDSPREFYCEAATQRLWYFHNASQGTPPPAGWTFEAPLLATLFDVRGTQAAPVLNVTFDGLTITGTAASYMMPHGKSSEPPNPSRAAHQPTLTISSAPHNLAGYPDFSLFFYRNPERRRLGPSARGRHPHRGRRGHDRAQQPLLALRRHGREHQRLRARHDHRRERVRLDGRGRRRLLGQDERRRRDRHGAAARHAHDEQHLQGNRALREAGLVLLRGRQRRGLHRGQHLLQHAARRHQLQWVLPHLVP